MGFAHEANISDDRLIQTTVGRGQSPRYGLQKTEMVGRILESDEPPRFNRIAPNRNCRIQESDLVYRNTRIIATNRQAATRIRPRQTTVA
ncbi:hypothetical protein NM96_09430 [Neisseria mucosa]|nr:hypothetical protein NM96_09430 [Neisseria mucosa]